LPASYWSTGRTASTSKRTLCDFINWRPRRFRLQNHRLRPLGRSSFRVSFLSVIKLNNDVYPEENRRRAALHCFSSRFNLFKQKRCHGTLAQRPELTKPEDNGLRPCDLQRLVPLQRPVRENLAFDEGKRGFPEQKRGRSGRKDTRNELLPVKTEV